MFNRVGAALSKYISPISSSKNDLQVDHDTDKSEEKRFERFHARKDSQSSGNENSSKDPKEDPKEKPNLRVIKYDQASQGLSSDGATETPSNTARSSSGDKPPTPGLSVSHAFLNLIRSIHQGRMLFAQWFGRGEYRKVQRNQRKGTRIRKGAMLDQKAE